MTYQLKHRRNVPPKTEPRPQPVPKHAGEYVHEDRTHERLGAEAFSDLLHAATIDSRAFGRTI